MSSSGYKVASPVPSHGKQFDSARPFRDTLSSMRGNSTFSTGQTQMPRTLFDPMYDTRGGQIEFKKIKPEELEFVGMHGSRGKLVRTRNI